MKHRYKILPLQDVMSFTQIFSYRLKFRIIFGTDMF